jgi:hypothetical protein
MAIVTNKAAVRRSLEQWFIAAREGKTLGARETAELSAHDAAALSSDYFYDLLVNDEDSQQYVEPIDTTTFADVEAAAPQAQSEDFFG